MQFSYTEVWFTDQNSKPLDIDINLTFVVNTSVKCKKMMRYSVQPRDAKDYRFLSFAKNMSKYIDKNISKSLSGNYSLCMLIKRQKLLYHVKQSAADAIKTSSKRIIQKTA